MDRKEKKAKQFSVFLLHRAGIASLEWARMPRRRRRMAKRRRTRRDTGSITADSRCSQWMHKPC